MERKKIENICTGIMEKKIGKYMERNEGKKQAGVCKGMQHTHTQKNGTGTGKMDRNNGVCKGTQERNKMEYAKERSTETKRNMQRKNAQK